MKFPPPEVLRLYRAAVTAGHLQHTPLNQVRIVALALQAVTRPEGKETGFFISHVEAGDWHCLDPSHVKTALVKLVNNVQLTPEELAQVRLPKGTQP